MNTRARRTRQGNMAACPELSDSSDRNLRKRRGEKFSSAKQTADDTEPENDISKYDKTGKIRLQTGTYWLTRIVLLRSIAFIYFVAFGVAYNQNKQLIGERGLLPCRDYLRSVKRYVGGKIGMSALAYTPSILWFMDWEDMDANLDAIALVGLALSGFVLLSGRANMIIMGLLWILYHSIVSVGQLWYSFGWESQLLETGFLGIFLCPFWSLAQMPRHCPLHLPKTISLFYSHVFIPVLKTVHLIVY